MSLVPPVCLVVGGAEQARSVWSSDGRRRRVKKLSSMTMTICTPIRYHDLNYPIDVVCINQSESHVFETTLVRRWAMQSRLDTSRQDGAR